MRIRWLVLLLLLASAAPALAAESDVTTEIFADTTAIQAGKLFQIAVRLTPQPGWHIYWLNPGDAGLPTRIRLDVPAGIRSSPIRYPLPQRMVLPGDIVNYGYEQPVTFIANIMPTNLPAPGEKVTIHAAISWLCCKEACVPGKKDVDLELPVGTPAPANADLFQAAHDALPEDACPADLADAPQTTLSGNQFTCRISWKQDVHDVELFPPVIESLDISDIHIDTRDRASVITFKARALSPLAPQQKSMNALIVLKDVAGKRRGFYTSMDLHAPLSGGPH